MVLAWNPLGRWSFLDINAWQERGWDVPQRGTLPKVEDWGWRLFAKPGPWNQMPGYLRSEAFFLYIDLLSMAPKDHDLKTTTLQSLINVKFSLHEFWARHENGCFKSGSFKIWIINYDSLKVVLSNQTLSKRLTSLIYGWRLYWYDITYGE